MIRRAISLVLLGIASVSAQTARTIHGHVVADDSSNPIRNARLVLTDDAASVPVLTDEDGRFTLPAVPPGQKTIAATKAGYAKATMPIADAMEIRLLRGGAISGRITDDLGEPLPFRIVAAGRLVRSDGRTSFETAVTAETDDRGDYRIFGLESGEFIFGLAGGRTFANTGAPICSGNIPPRDFYPNAVTPEDAKPIAVRAGDEITQIDFTVALPPASLRAQLIRPMAPARPAGSGAIRGRIVSSHGRPLRAAQVTVSSPDRMIQPEATLTDDDGRYERPPGDAAVIAFSTNRNEWRRVTRFRNQALAHDGAFDLELPPGSYYVAAIDPAEQFWANRPWEDVEFLDALVAGATRVTLSEGQGDTISVRLIPTP